MSSVAGGPNTFVPSFEGSARARITFSRNPKSFALPNYAAHRQVNKPVGLYLKTDAQQASRVVDRYRSRWADGALGTPSVDGQVEFDFLAFRCERYKEDFFIGEEAVKAADFDVVTVNLDASAQRLMTGRSMDAIAELQGASWGSNTGAAATIGGAKWDAATSSNQAILKGIQAASLQIHKATQGAVQPGQMKLVIGPALAHVIRATSEIVDFVKQHQGAPALMSQQSQEFFHLWGVPKYLYGMEVVVEDAVRTSSAKGATLAQDYILGNDEAYIVTNTVDVTASDNLPPGEGVRIYDTLTLFMYQDMLVESKSDVDNKVVWARAIDYFDTVVTSTESGYRITDTFT